MLKYIVKRFLFGILTLWVIITLTFILMHSIPGNPFANDKMIKPEIMQNLNEKYGLNKPLQEQYGIYFKNLLKGDFGVSLKYKNRSVNSMIASGFPVSMTLGMIACVLGIGLGILFGIIAGCNRSKLPDYLVIIISILGVSVPSFVFASLFQYFFANKLRWFPASGWGTLAAIVLPSCALGFRMVAYIGRMMRTSMLDVLGQDYIKTAKARGLSQVDIIRRHAVRNAITPIVTVAGSMIAGTLVGSFVVENIFNIPGMGKFLVGAVKDSDYTVILGMTAFYAVILVVVTFIVDVLYVAIDPRVKLD